MRLWGLGLFFILAAVRSGDFSTLRDQEKGLCALSIQGKPLVMTGWAVRGKGGLAFEPLEKELPSRLRISGGRTPEAGLAYRVSGRLFCHPAHDNERNYGARPAFFFRPLHWETLPREATRFPFRDRLFAPLVPFPFLHAIAVATWTGDAGETDRATLEWFRVAGLLPVLALSGQHVGILIAGIESILALVTFGGNAWYPFWRRYRMLLGSLLLYVTSGESGSMLRTLGMAIFFCLLKTRMLATPPLQWASTSVAIVIAISPGVLDEPGFLLSAAGTFLLFRASEKTGGAGLFVTAVLLPALLPVGMLPWSAFYFSKVPLAASLFQLVVGAIWAAVFLPAGFFLPLLAWGLPRFAVVWLCGGLERIGLALDSGFTKFLPAIRDGYVTVLRPAFFEALALETVVLTLLAVILSRGWHKRRIPQRNSR